MRSARCASCASRARDRRGARDARAHRPRRPGPARRAPRRADADELVNRYERPVPGELIHIDVKKLGRVGRRPPGGRRPAPLRGAGCSFVHVCVDDCTRLAYVEVLDSTRRDVVCAFLQRAVAVVCRHGVDVQRLMTDNGPGYRSTAHAALCRRARVRHLLHQPYRPRRTARQTIHQDPPALGPAGAYDQLPTPRPARIPDPYNTDRPHRALGPAPSQRLPNGTTRLRLQLARERRDDPREHVARRVAAEEHVHVRVARQATCERRESPGRLRLEPGVRAPLARRQEAPVLGAREQREARGGCRGGAAAKSSGRPVDGVVDRDEVAGRRRTCPSARRTSSAPSRTRG